MRSIIIIFFYTLSRWSIDVTAEDVRADCFDSITTADANSDGKLSKTEYATFLADYLPDCVKYQTGARNLTDYQSAAFDAYYCGKCTIQSGDIGCCFSDTTDTDKVIEYENSDDVQGGICAAATSAAVLDGCPISDIVDVPTIPPINGTDLGNDAPFNYSDCLKALPNVDTDKNKRLSKKEYGALLVQLYCYNSTNLTSAQSLIYDTLACGTCLLSDNQTDCCSGNGELFYEGTVNEVSICSSAGGGAFAECEANVTISENPDIPEPPETFDPDAPQCAEALAGVDSNADNLITRQDYANFLAIRHPDCYSAGQDLTLAQNGLFTAMSCAYCSQQSLFNASCCLGDDALVSIDGARVASDDRSSTQTDNLLTVCGSADAGALVDCNTLFNETTSSQTTNTTKAPSASQSTSSSPTPTTADGVSDTSSAPSLSDAEVVSPTTPPRPTSPTKAPVTNDATKSPVIASVTSAPNGGSSSTSSSSIIYSSDILLKIMAMVAVFGL